MNFLTLNLLTILCLSPILITIGYFVFRSGKPSEAEKQYNDFYATIEFYIQDWPNLEWCKNALYGFVVELEKMPYKKPEKSQVLRGRIDYKFRDKAQDEIIELKKQHEDMVFLAEGLQYEHQGSLQAAAYAKANNIKTRIAELEKQSYCLETGV